MPSPTPITPIVEFARSEKGLRSSGAFNQLFVQRDRFRGWWCPYFLF